MKILHGDKGTWVSRFPRLRKAIDLILKGMEAPASELQRGFGR